MLGYIVNTSKSSLSLAEMKTEFRRSAKMQSGYVASCEASTSLLDIPEILHRLLLHFKLIACVDVRKSLIQLFVISSTRVRSAPS